MVTLPTLWIVANPITDPFRLEFDSRLTGRKLAADIREQTEARAGHRRFLKTDALAQLHALMNAFRGSKRGSSHLGRRNATPLPPICLRVVSACWTWMFSCIGGPVR